MPEYQNVNFTRKRLSELLEANIVSILTEATTAHHETVLADQTMSAGADAA